MKVYVIMTGSQDCQECFEVHESKEEAYKRVKELNAVRNKYYLDTEIPFFPKTKLEKALE